jgi:hypothetical protein
MSYDNMSSVSQNVLKFYILRNTTQVIVRHRICLQTDGHGETSIPPYNFVVGGITTFIERERVLVIRLITNIVVSLLNLYINTLQIKRYINP